jgi:hypothetical protein
MNKATSTRKLAGLIGSAPIPRAFFRDYGHEHGELLARMIITEGYIHTVTPKGRARLLKTATWAELVRAYLQPRRAIPDELAGDGYTEDDWRRTPTLRTSWACRQANRDLKQQAAAR